MNYRFLVVTLLMGTVCRGDDGPANGNSAETTPNGATRFEEFKSQDPDGVTTFKLTVNAAREPEPALKYRIWPEYRRQKPGDAVPFYYRAMLLHVQNVESRAKSWKEEYGAEFESKWSRMPLARLPLAQVRSYIQQHQHIFGELQTAAYREQCNWDYRLRELKGTEAYEFLLPDVQYTRQMARDVVLQARLHIAERECEKALEALRVGYKMARDVAEPHTLINDLVGVAIAGMCNQAVLEWLATDQAPNLYWALAGLPATLIDMRPALEHELTMPLQIFPLLADAETRQQSAEEWRRDVGEIVATVRELNGANGPAIEWSMAFLVMRGYPRAKRDLLEWGYAPDRIEKMPVLQVVAIHEARTLRHISDEMLKWTLLPPAEAQAGMHRTMETLRKEGYFGRGASSREIIPLANLLFPALEKASLASVRNQRQLAALRAIEALRMQAAETGAWPDNLEDVSLVPVPHDPYGGKPFAYRREGDTAVLEFPAAEGDNSQDGRRYVLTLAGDAKP